MNSGQKMPLYQGDDGKLYFNFAVGLSVLIRERIGKEIKEYALTVTGCHYDGATEYYDVERDGLPLPSQQSANRVKFLVSRYGVKTLAAGVRRELPLLLEEVKAYYESREQWHAWALRKAESLPRYDTLSRAASSYSQPIGIALAYERTEEAARLQQEQFKAQRELEQYLTENGIQPYLLKEPPHCQSCGGKGYLPGGKICRCALAQTAKIKEYNAAKRRKEAQ